MFDGVEEMRQFQTKSEAYALMLRARLILGYYFVEGLYHLRHIYRIKSLNKDFCRFLSIVVSGKRKMAFHQQNY